LQEVNEFYLISLVVPSHDFAIRIIAEDWR